MYHIIDFRAVVKHAYYGAKDDEAIHCEKTDRYFNHWQVGASGIITRVVRKILESGEGPRQTIVAHDMGSDYRRGLYADYKGAKSKKDEEKSPVEVEQLDLLFDWAKKFFSAFGATQIGVKGVEADDVIAWLCKGLSGPKTVYTVDADILALVDDETCVYLKGEPFFGREGEKAHDGAMVPFHLTSLAKSMLGDKSDLYIGVKGIGPAAWNKMREAFGDDGLEELQQIVSTGNTDYLDECIADSGDKTLIKLRDNFADWRLGWKLAELHPELCWKPRTKKLVKPMVHKRVPNPTQLHRLLSVIDCLDMWDDEFAPCMPSPFAVTAENWEEMKAAIFEEIKAGDITAFDYESSDKAQIRAFRMASASGENFVDTMSQNLTGASFQFGKHLENVIYIPVDHKDSPNLPPAVILEILEFAEKHTTLVAHNAYFEGIVTKVNLGKWLANVQDTRIMKRFYDENSEAGLKFLSLEYLGYEQTSYHDTLAAGNGGQGVKSMCELTLDEVFQYGTDDSLVTGHLHDLLKLLLQLDGQWDFYQEWAVRPTEVLQRSYVEGVDINWALQRRIHERDLETIEEGMKDLRDILERNVSGNITPGCESLISAERDYVFRAAKRKADGDSDLAGQRLSEWKKKLQAACQYVPYRQEEVMPDFAFTAKQISAAAVKVGLPELETLSNKAWAEYLTLVGAEGFKDGWSVEDNQAELITAVNKAMYLGLLKLTDLRKKAEDNPDDELAAARYAEASAYKDELGQVVQRIAGVEPRVVEFGDPLNVGSPQQMQQLLYCKIGVPVRLRGKAAGKGRKSIGITEAGPSTDEKAIETALANDIVKDSWQHKALKVLLRVKSATTRCSLYHDKLPLWRHVDGKVHPFVTDFGTDTGRPTSSAPNVLQVSKKDKEMRSMYIPPDPDHVCVAIDFNGQEIRLMANLANDPVMLSVYDPLNEKDLHSMTGSGIAKMSYEDFIEAKDNEHHKLNKITNDIRKQAKGVNFGMAYGAGPGTLSRNLIVPVDVAKKLLDDTFKLYSRIQPWQQETARFMEKNGFTLTAFGTKRHATADIFSNDSGKVSRQHRQGTNATIQGTAAQMLRIVLTKVAASGMLDRLRMRFFAPIYDEVVAWVHKDDVLAYCIEMGGYMEESTPPGHVVRQVPEYSIGPDWGRVHELGRDISPENVQRAVDRSLEEAKDIWAVDVLQPFNPILKRTIVELDEDSEPDPEMDMGMCA